ncbi:MAG: hypothetical protein SOR86_04955, partial [Sodaliphilus sp.]|nr:hypothetical protein [Sodaliphilus sp.]
QLKQFPHKKAFSQKPGKRLYRRHFFPKKRPLPSKIPQKHVYFQCFRLWHVTKALLIASKHAEGMSLRNDEITNLTHPHYLLA